MKQSGGGGHVNQLIPVVARLHPGEQFASWVNRSAALVNLSPTAWLRPTGLGHLSADGGTDVWGVHLTDTTLGRLSTATGTDPVTIAGSLVSALPVPVRIDPTDPAGSVRAAAAAAPVWFTRSRVCPACLAAHQRWALVWKLKAFAVCPVHSGVLVDRCPGCGLPVGTGRNGRLAPPRPDLTANPVVCHNLVPVDHGRGRRRVRRCGHDLSTVTAVSASSEQLTAAARMAAMVDRHRHGDPDAAVWFTALHAAAATLLWCAEPDDVDTDSRDRFAEFVAARDRDGRGPVVSWTGLVDDATVAAAVVPTAVRVADGDDVDAVFGWLSDRAVRRWTARRSGRRGLEDGFGFPEPWRQRWQSQVTARRHRFTHHTPSVTGSVLPVSAVPAVLPDGLHTRFGGLVPNTADRTARVFEALCVARTVGAATWGTAATSVGLPASVGVRVADVVVRRVTAAGTRDAVWAAAADVAATLAAAFTAGDAVDFGPVRAALTDIVEIPASVWHTMCVTTGTHPGRGPARRRAAAAWLWEHTAGSDWRWSPAAVTAETVGMRRDSFRDHYRRFDRWLPDTTADSLQTWATTLTGTPGEEMAA